MLDTFILTNVISYCQFAPFVIVWCSSLSFIKDFILKSVFSGINRAAKSIQLCLTLCDPIDGSLPGSPVPGILQARTLEWVAISFSNALKWNQ